MSDKSSCSGEKFLAPGVDYVMHNYEKSDDPTVIAICEQIQTVYDPEFAIVDVYTLGLIYSILVDYDECEVYIVMTYTTPACPEGELIQTLIRNSITSVLPTYTVRIDITFDPQRSLDMIKDQDLRRMFE